MKKLFIILISGTALVVVVAVVAAWMSWQPQSWYDPPDYSDSRVARIADRAEYRLNEEFHKIRSSEDSWRLRISDEAMNAWLSGRLEDLLTHDEDYEIPKEIQGLQVHTTEVGIWLAAMVEIDNYQSRPFAIQLGIWVDNDKGYVEPSAIRLGKIPLPLLFLNKVLDDLRVDIGEFEPIIPLRDDREVEIQAIDFEEGAIVITCKTYLPQ